MPIHVVRLGTPRAPDEGLRLGTVRRPPRGVPKRDWSRRDYYDVWLPTLAPSQALLTRLPRDAPARAAAWRAFARDYRREMARPDARATLVLLAALSTTTNFAVGCYCEDESRCHRTILRELLRAHGAIIAGD